MIVSSVSGTCVTLTSGIQYLYSSGTEVNFYKSFFIFNNYNGVDSSKGTLYRFDAYTGECLSLNVSVEYKDVKAATFYRFRNIFFDHPDIDALIYIKGTNAKICDVSNLIWGASASSMDDDFIGVDGSAPDNNKWGN